jgi:hypothetical protein
MQSLWFNRSQLLLYFFINCNAYFQSTGKDIFHKKKWELLAVGKFSLFLIFVAADAKTAVCYYFRIKSSLLIDLLNSLFTFISLSLPKFTLFRLLSFELFLSTHVSERKNRILQTASKHYYRERRRRKVCNWKRGSIVTVIFLRTNVRKRHG